MKKAKVLIVSSVYNESIVKNLIYTALKQLNTQLWIQKSLIKVPGAFEIPVAIEKYIKKFDGIVALGCIIKGQTNNFDLISKSITDSLIQISIKHKKPIGNGIITCLNKKQAIVRSSLNKKNKGEEAAKAIVSVLKI